MHVTVNLVENLCNGDLPSLVSPEAPRDGESGEMDTLFTFGEKFTSV